MTENKTDENMETPTKRRFVTLDNEDLDSLLDSAQAQSTKYNTTYAISVYKGMY